MHLSFLVGTKLEMLWSLPEGLPERWLAELLALMDQPGGVGGGVCMGHHCPFAVPAAGTKYVAVLGAGKVCAPHHGSQAREPLTAASAVPVQRVLGIPAPTGSFIKNSILIKF